MLAECSERAAGRVEHPNPELLPMRLWYVLIRDPGHERAQLFGLRHVRPPYLYAKARAAPSGMAGMKLRFPGTRGEIEARTPLHRMHSCLLVEGRVLVDCGADWLGKIEALGREAIALTHAHHRVFD